MGDVAHIRARVRFAENMLRLRHERGWSQEELAARGNLHRNYIGPIERAERNVGVDVMEKVADALGVSLSMMLEDTPEQTDEHSA